MTNPPRTPQSTYLKESTSTLRDGGTMDERIRGWQDELKGFEEESAKVGEDNVRAAREALDAMCESASAFQRATIDNYDAARDDLEKKWAALERVFRTCRRAASGGRWPAI